MRLKLVGASVRRAVAVTMRFLALAALALAGSAANDDYVALKAFYESTGGSGWACNANWDMSNTDVCGWGPSVQQCSGAPQVTCEPPAGGRVNFLCAPALSIFYRPPHGDTPPRRPRARRDLAGNSLSGTIPTEVGLLTKLTDSLCARPPLRHPAATNDERPPRCIAA